MDIDQENEKRLVSMLDRAIGFVRYAEAKNGSVVAIAVALLVGILKSVSTGSCVSKFFFIGAVVMITIGAIISLVSFIPILQPKRGGGTKENGSERNPFFFGHTAELSPDEFLNELYRDGGKDRHHMELFYAEQIRTNSDIANRKFDKFNRACLSMLGGILFLACGLVAVLI